MAEIKYKQLMQHIIAQIQNGSYTDKLPSEMELCAQFQHSRQTVRNALAQLESMHYITRRRGSGTYVNKETLSTMAPSRNGRQIGVLTTYITDYIFPSILRGIEQTLSAAGYAMRLSSSCNSIANERAILLEYIAAPPCGLIVEGTKTALPNPNVALYRQLQAMGVPIVFLNGCYPELKQAVSVLMDDAQGGELLVDYLHSKGFSQLAGLFKSDDMQGVQRYEGFIKGIWKHGMRLQEQNLRWFSTESRKTLSSVLLPSMLEIFRSCDAVVCYNDEIAVQLLRLLQQEKLFAEVVSFDRSHYSRFSAKPFLSLPHPKAQLGRIAARKLLAMAAGAEESSLLLPWRLPETEPTADSDAAKRADSIQQGLRPEQGKE